MNVIYKSRDGEIPLEYGDKILSVSNVDVYKTKSRIFDVTDKFVDSIVDHTHHAGHEWFISEGSDGITHISCEHDYHMYSLRRYTPELIHQYYCLMMLSAAGSRLHSYLGDCVVTVRDKCYTFIFREFTIEYFVDSVPASFHNDVMYALEKYICDRADIDYLKVRDIPSSKLAKCGSNRDLIGLLFKYCRV